MEIWNDDDDDELYEGWMGVVLTTIDKFHCYLNFEINYCKI